MELIQIITKSRLILLAPLLALVFLGCDSGKPATIPSHVTLKQRLEHALTGELLQVWYPRVIDSIHGGYITDYDYAWNEDGKQNKMIVTQSRHVWTASQAAELFPENPVYKEAGAHGIPFLREKMWDQEQGGFWQLVNQKGKPLEHGGEGKYLKTAYGNAFAIYGLAAYYKLSNEEEALKLATDCYQWLEANSHDSVNLGYFQFMEPDGTPLLDGNAETPPKDQNSSIHLLEAFTELYQVWPDISLRNRLEEMLILVRDTITDPKGYLHLFSSQDWTHLSYRDSTDEAREEHYHLDHVSFGHDIETAYLMMEAAELLYDEVDEKTEQIAKRMTDHSLKFGWDKQYGGLYDGGYYFSGEDTVRIVKNTKQWWAQAEAMNTLQIMAELYPDDPMEYGDKFLKQWEYIDTYLVDHEHGGWYIDGVDQSPKAKMGVKSSIWKGPYHTFRTLKNCWERLD